MALATCEMYLLDEFVKPPFETWPPKLCQTHIWQDIAQNIRSNISFNKSDNIFLSKTILILFVRCFGEKKRNTLGTYLPEIFLTNLLGWLVISQKCPKHFFGHYPSAILLEISPTNSPCRNFTYTRICSNRSVFFIHQTELTPENFYTKELFHQKRLYTKQFLHQEPLIRKGFYTRNLYHHRHLTPNIFFIYTYTRTPENSYKKTQRTISTAGTLYTKGVLHHRQSAPKSLYTQRLLQQTNCTKQFLRRATFTPEDVYTWIVYIPKFLTPKPFLPANLYNKICLHQKPFAPNI